MLWVLENFCGISEVSDVAKAKNGLAPVQNTFLMRTEMELYPSMPSRIVKKCLKSRERSWDVMGPRASSKSPK